MARRLDFLKILFEIFPRPLTTWTDSMQDIYGVASLHLPFGSWRCYVQAADKLDSESLTQICCCLSFSTGFTHPRGADLESTGLVYGKIESTTGNKADLLAGAVAAELLPRPTLAWDWALYAVYSCLLASDYWNCLCMCAP